jgi:hypothetical protein
MNDVGGRWSYNELIRKMQLSRTRCDVARTEYDRPKTTPSQDPRSRRARFCGRRRSCFPANCRGNHYREKEIHGGYWSSNTARAGVDAGDDGIPRWFHRRRRRARAESGPRPRRRQAAPDNRRRAPPTPSTSARTNF